MLFFSTRGFYIQKNRKKMTMNDSNVLIFLLHIEKYTRFGKNKCKILRFFYAFVIAQSFAKILMDR